MLKQKIVKVAFIRNFFLLFFNLYYDSYRFYICVFIKG